jgi:hypothetical protein
MPMSRGAARDEAPVEGDRMPATRSGSWAVGLAAASLVLLLSWSRLGRLGGVPGLLFGLVGGVLALVAIARRGERSVTVFLALLPFLSVVLFLLAELVAGDGR